MYKRKKKVRKDQKKELQDIKQQMKKLKTGVNDSLQKIGDIITISHTAVQMMKAEPIDVGGGEFYQPVVIIGKALEPLADRRGMNTRDPPVVRVR